MHGRLQLVMKSIVLLISVTLVLALFAWPLVQPATAAGETVNIWLTTPNQSSLLQQQGSLNFASISGSNSLTITVNPATRYQQMDGWGASLTDSSAWLIYNSSARNTIMNDLFSKTSGIGLSMLRQPMGASDFSRSGNYNFDNTCCDLNDFSISHDNGYIIPLLVQSRQINSSMKVILTPWSPPGWMKTSGSMIGGGLNHATYSDALAQYFVRTVQAYQASGVPIYGITPQNEPLYSPPGYPGSLMAAGDQGQWIGYNLGPAMNNAGLGAVKIMAYDHNWDQTSYPLTVFGNSVANPYVDGVAWHCYGGNVSAQNTVHNSYPNKDAWLTECSGGNWAPYYNDFAANLKGMTENLIILNARYWGKSTILWNAALDPNNGPTNGGCTTCRGVVTVNGGSYIRTVDYYILGHASKFVDAGAYRIESNTFGGSSIEDVAFQNPDGSIVVVALNNASSTQTFRIVWNNQMINYSIPAGAVATLKWTPGSIPPTTPPPTTPPAGQAPYGGTPWAVPGTVQAENYDTGGEGVAYHDSETANQGGAFRTDGVDIQATTDTGGGNNVGWTAAGEWLEYTVNVTASGTYSLNARTASQSGGGSLHVEIDGVNVTGAMAIPSTGAWQTWTTVTRTGVSLSAGQHVMRIGIDAAGFNLNWVSFTGGTPPPTTPPPTTNLALNRPATSSSNETTAFTPNLAVDGNTGTRWSSAFSDPQWIRIDLGSTRTISRVVLRWEAAYGRAYQIQTSADGTTWTTIYSTTTGNGAVDDLTISGSGRYIRMYGTARGTAYGYSLYEFEVYGN